MLNNIQKMPEFLSNYLKYKEYIEFYPSTSVKLMYYSISSFLKYVAIAEEDKITIENYKNVTIYDFKISTLRTITRQTIIEYIYFLSDTLNNSAKTRNNKIIHLKSFFEYLYNNNFININPTLNINLAKTERRNPKYLNINESKKLLSSTIKSNQKEKLRNYCIICLFLNCGIRLSELTKIDISDIKFDEKTLKIHGKGNKERIIYLDNACLESLKEYLKERKKIKLNTIDKDALFLSNRNKRISNRSVQAIVKNEISDTFNNEKDYIHTHSLRHTSASLLFNENDTNILVIKKILGHSSLKSTEVYTHISSDKMKKIMENCTISSILRNKEEKV